MRARWWATACGMALLAIATGRAEAQVINELAGNYTIGSNPNGNWTYGQYQGGALAPSTFLPFDDSGVVSSGPFAGEAYWDNSAHTSDPNIDYNTTSANINTGSGSGNIEWVAHKVTFGPYQGPTVARWTAPSAGTYDVSAAFQTVQIVNAPPTAYIFRDQGTTPLADIQLTDPNNNQFGDVAKFSQVLTLARGETIDFVIYGNNAANKTTQVDATITAVPEPATWLMCCAGLLGAGFACRRRRSATAA